MMAGLLGMSTTSLRYSFDPRASLDQAGLCLSLHRTSSLSVIVSEGYLPECFVDVGWQLFVWRGQALRRGALGITRDDSIKQGD